jgi:hypothetical protein
MTEHSSLLFIPYERLVGLNGPHSLYFKPLQRQTIPKYGRRLLIAAQDKYLSSKLHPDSNMAPTYYLLMMRK